MPETSAEKVNVLLVDDQPGKLIVNETILTNLDVNVIKAHSGAAALSHLSRTDIAVVLLDVSMPETGGFELAEIIRQQPRNQTTAILFLSTVHLSDADRLRGYKLGAVDYVSVPIAPEVLRAKVQLFAALYRKTRESERLMLELAHRVRQSERRRDEFLALLAHELRNPLAPVQNAINVMRLKNWTDPDLLWCRDVIERQVKQLTRLLDDLLDISRITQGKVTLQRETVDLIAVVAGAVETCRPQIDTLRHDLVVEVPDGPVLVDGDSARLIQVVSNILNNAAGYQTEGGYIKITVSNRPGVAVITVHDRGPGIKPEQMAQVFDLFWQGDRAPGCMQGGLGVGLSLVRSLVEIHGGTVRCRSDVRGGGTEFEIRLPALGQQIGGGSPATEQTDKQTKSKTAMLRRILVVDDNVDAAESLAMLLKLHGHEVMVATDSRTALKIAKEARPSVILLDIGLPVMDGYEVCRRVRQQGMTKTQIIAVTGYGQEQDRQCSYDAGFDAHTVKPVDISEVLKLMAARN